VRLPAIRGVIRRRLLINFRVDPTILRAQIPPRFRPKLHMGHGIAGICLIRLEEMRPRRLPILLGVSSENAAHRVAVVWDAEDGGPREGVYIPRRDTGSLLNHVTGGRLFPGEHHRARFQVEESAAAVDFSMASDDGAVSVRVRGRFGGDLPTGSCFDSLATASAFFEGGSIGYSATREPGRLDGVELRTEEWHVEALQVDEVYSSYFADPGRFPTGSVSFDCALAMRSIAHEWHSANDLYL
jgi:hypothetical protein